MMWVQYILIREKYKLDIFHTTNNTYLFYLRDLLSEFIFMFRKFKFSCSLKYFKKRIDKEKKHQNDDDVWEIGKKNE